jgi:hypothetical protein
VRDYRKSTMSGAFGNAQIVVNPLPNGLYAIDVIRDEENTHKVRRVVSQRSASFMYLTSMNLFIVLSADTLVWAPFESDGGVQEHARPLGSNDRNPCIAVHIPHPEDSVSACVRYMRPPSLLFRGQSLCPFE